MRRAIVLLVLLAAAPLPAPAGAAVPPPPAGWVLALPDTVRLPGPQVRLGDVNLETLPDVAAAVVLAGDGRPGQTAVIERRIVLRRLVEGGIASGVARCAGAERCVVLFTGRAADEAQLRASVTALLEPLLPPAPPGAPASWLELEVAAPALAADGWSVELTDPQPLRAGRNLVPLRVTGGGRSARVTASVVCHLYGEVAAARAPVAASASLAAAQFSWEWRDLTTVAPGLAIGREAVEGRSAGRSLAVGEALRQADLRDTPLVRAGDAVDLAVRRGGVVVTVRATARQDGVMGQLVTVRNDINGKLATARVAGPGLVEWRR